MTVNATSTFENLYEAIQWLQCMISFCCCFCHSFCLQDLLHPMTIFGGGYTKSNSMILLHSPKKNILFLAFERHLSMLSSFGQ